MEQWDEENLRNKVVNCISIAEALTAINVTVCSQNYRKFNKLVKRYGIDVSHFLGQRYLKGKKRIVKNTPIEKMLTRDSKFDPQYIKRRLIREKILECKCAMPYCSITDWHGTPITLQLDHINGVNTDNRVENLRLLCPNCHSQTNTYCGRNVKKPINMKKKENNKCADCNIAINGYSAKCRKCSAPNKDKFKITWPDTNRLIELIKSSGFLSAGKTLGVSDNAIRRRLKALGYDPKLIKQL